MTRFRRIALVAAVLPLTVLVGLRSAWAMYACQADGEVRGACCCPRKQHSDRTVPDEAPRMAASGCCDVTLGKSPEAPQAREPVRADASGVPLVLAASVSSPSVRAAVGTRTARRPVARPPPRSVPTYLALRSILR